MSIFMHSFIILFFQFGFVLSSPNSNILKRKIVGEELMKKTMVLEEKWSNLIHPLANIFYATFYYNPNVNVKFLFEKGALKIEDDWKQGKLMFIFVPEYFELPIKLPPHILEYAKRHFGGYQLPMWKENLNVKKVKEELEKLGDLYLDSFYKNLVINKGENGEEMSVDFKHDYKLDKRYKFNEKAKIWFMMESSGIVVQNIFSIFAEAKLFIEIVVKTILLTCQLDVNLEMEMNEENANKSEITKCILGKKFKQRNLMTNFGKIIKAVEEWKSEKLESRKKFESTFERIVEDSRSIGFEMRKNYLKDKKFFHETQPKYTIFEQMKLYLKEKSESEWNYLNEEILQNIGICIRIFQFASIIQHEILTHILDCPMLIDLNSHKNTLEYLQRSIFLLEKALEETILGTISTELKFNEEIEKLEEKWEELQNKTMEINTENEELKKLKKEIDNIEKENAEIRRRVAETEGYKKRVEKYKMEYSRIFLGFLPELMNLQIDLVDSKKLANENAKKKFSLNNNQKIKIANILFEILENRITEKTLMSTINEKHRIELKAMKGGNENEEAIKRLENAQNNERNFFKYLDNLTKIIYLDFGIWVKFPPSEKKEYKNLVHSIIGSNIAIFFEIIKKWGKNDANFYNNVHVLFMKNLKNHFRNLNLRSHGPYYKNNQKRFAMIFEPNKQMEMLIENFIHCNNNNEEAGPSNDPMDMDYLNVKEESDEMEIDE